MLWFMVDRSPLGRLYYILKYISNLNRTMPFFCQWLIVRLAKPSVYYWCSCISHDFDVTTGFIPMYYTRICICILYFIPYIQNNQNIALQKCCYTYIFNGISIIFIKSIIGLSCMQQLLLVTIILCVTIKNLNVDDL